MSALIQAQDLVKLFGTRANPVHALGPVSFEIPQGSFTLIIGRSGSGKSTLLNLLCGLDTPTSGELTVGADVIHRYNTNKMAAYRAKIGIVFQAYHLLPNLNVRENVLLGGWAGDAPVTTEQADVLLETLGLKHRATANVKTLSGGEKQRAAIARALITSPEVLFCDEPTGALDSESEQQVLDILLELHQKGQTIVMVTHNPDFIKLADQVIRLKDGHITK